MEHLGLVNKWNGTDVINNKFPWNWSSNSVPFEAPVWTVLNLLYKQHYEVNQTLLENNVSGQVGMGKLEHCGAEVKLIIL